MNQITDMPPDSTFGLDFNYAAWTPDTVITLCNVPWNNDYRDIVKFNTAADLNAYINSRPNYVATDVSYHKVATTVKLDIPFNAAYKFNYLRAHNGVQPINTPGDEARDFYYFITDVRYVAPDTTEFVIQLDVWSTFQFYATFGNCYIEHGHIGVANVNNFNNYGRDYLTTPEGIDVGGEYQVINQATQAIMAYDAADMADINNAVAWDILVCSTVDLLADAGDKTSPNLVSTDGGNFFFLPSGANYYVFSGKMQSFVQWMHNMKDKPWVTQGVISITVIPPINRYIPSFTFAADGIPTLAPTQVLPPRRYEMMSDWRNDAMVQGNIPARYATVKDKFFTYPYMVLELTTFTGTPVLIKPEAWADDNATVLERISPIPPNQRVTIGPYKYNAKVGSPTEPFLPGVPASGPGGDDYGDYLDIATQITNFPALAIVNNGALSYLAANTHGIAYQYSSADWAETRALHGNAVSYDQASAGMALTQQLTGIGISADRAQTAIQNTIENQQAVMGAIGSVVGGAQGFAGGPAAGVAGVAGGLGSAALGAIQHGLNIANNNASMGVRNSAAQSSADAQTGTAGIMRDTNKDLGDWAARGDYQNAIAATNAKVQDAKLIQPTTSGQVGGEAMNLVNNTSVVSLRIKMIDQAAIRRIGEYWLRYGYAVGQFGTLPTSLMVMSKFTYWKLKETYIVSATMPEAFKQVLRGIFEKGVTVWANPADIGAIDLATNTPIGGITL